MSFDTTAGTRGARQPGGFVFRWGNQLMASRIRKGGAKFLRSARDFAREEWPLRGSAADVLT